MNILKKLQKQPEHIRKMILWIAVVVVGLGLAIWWIHSSYWKIKEFQPKEIIKEQWINNIEQQLKQEI